MAVKIRSANKKRGLGKEGSPPVSGRLGPPKRKKVLRPGLKRSATGAVVKDRRVARVAKRKTLAKLNRGPYRKWR
jgi:hypothetical protein